MRHPCLVFVCSLLLAACAAQPPAPPRLISHGAAGLVLGTVSCHFVESDGAGASQALMVRFERLDGGQDYLLLARMDRDTQRGFFSGPLPAGAYVFRDAHVAGQRLAAGGMQMPFEVQAGQVSDLGHYSLGPPALGLMRVR